MIKPEKFPLGRIVVTDAATTWLSAGQIERALARHAAGDWGDVCPVTADDNNAATHQGGPLISVYGRHGPSHLVTTRGNPPITKLSMASEWSAPHGS